MSACIRSGRKDRPELVAVSKKKELSTLLAAYHEGQRVFGENYVQELVSKKTGFDAAGLQDVDFHFIGHLQTNKVKQLLPHVSTIESVGSLRLLAEISNRPAQIQKKIRCYFEVNIDAEPSKGGFRPEDLPALVQALGEPHPFVIPCGLMCIPDPDKDPKAAFLRLKELSLMHGRILGNGLSMGMSQDFELAIECGSTVVRVGSAIFGQRV